MMRKRTPRKDFTGFRNGGFVVVGNDRLDGKIPSLCDCGKSFYVDVSNIRNQKSCGCNLFRKGRELKDGTFMKHHPLRNTWSGILFRCNNPKSKDYIKYGGRGIKVCEEWSNGVDGFENFIKDVGPKPTPRHSIDRIDNEKGYSKENCRWATNIEQGFNRRTSKPFEHNGEMVTVSEIERRTGIPKHVLWKRINYGWSVELAFSTPYVKGKKTKNFNLL